MKIPRHIIDKHTEGVEELRFYGHSVTELDRNELLAFANLCARSLKEQHERFLNFIDTTRALNVRETSRGILR